MNRLESSVGWLGPHLVRILSEHDTSRSNSATCPHCGFYNHPDSDVRDAGDNQQHCANCGEMFERTV